MRVQNEYTRLSVSDKGSVIKMATYILIYTCFNYYVLLLPYY